MRTLPTRQLGFFGAAVLLAGTLAWLGQGVAAQVSIDDDDIGGVVVARADRKPASGSSPKPTTSTPSIARSW